MKKFILSNGMMLLVSMSVFAQQLVMHNPSSAEKAKLTNSSFMWESSSHDFGTIEKGVPVTAVFEFTNHGSVPLSISKVSTPCGCTVADYTKRSLAPGETGYIKATYNAVREGAFHKKISVFTSEGEEKSLTLKGVVN